MTKSTHYGDIEEGNYTACNGNAYNYEMDITDDWELVSCKNCLKAKANVLISEAHDEAHIDEDMGNFVEFMKEYEKEQGGNQ